MFDVGGGGAERSVGAERNSAVDVGAVESELAVLCGIGNATVAAQVRLIALVLAGRLWHQWGVRSAGHWVGWQLGVDQGRARRLVAIARRRTQLPVAFAAFEAGELSEDQMVLICRHTPGPCDESVTGFAKLATVAQLRRTLSRYRWDPDDADTEPEPEPDVDERRQASFHFNDDGLWELFARLSPEEGAAMEAALMAARDDLFHARFEDDSQGHQPEEISWADALVHLGELGSSPEATGHPVRERHRRGCSILCVRCPNPL